MGKTVFITFFTLFLSRLIAAQGNSASMVTHFRNKIINSEIENEFSDPSKLLIDESRLDYFQTPAQNDRIERLPEQPNVSFSQYGGYVKIDEKKEKSLYYYFVEAQESPNTSPLVLWLNGGPGCSSLGYGAMEELGPFRVQSDGKTLYANEYGWNQVANVLFLESPAGVGFSYAKTKAAYASVGDNQTAIDNYVFLKNWLTKFPDYKSRDVYLTGESYAGHYVPQLAQTILHQNKRAKSNTINLKGIMIGNAVINDETDAKGRFEYWGSHALISDDLTNQIMKYCDFSPNVPRQKKACDKAVNETNKVFDEIDVYNIYWPKCHDSNLTGNPKKYSVLEFDPCSDNYVYAYLNRPDVQKALHANVTKIPYAWDFCSAGVNDKWTDSPFTVLPILKELMENRLRVWIYSGDVDGRVPVTATQLSIKDMHLQINDSWHPWYSAKEDVGGYTQAYKGNLTFATIRGAGHAVPSYKPQAALVLITHFLKGEKLPTSTNPT